MKLYEVEKHGSLLMLHAFVAGPSGKAYPKLLIDTGSAYTILSQEILESIGCKPTFPEKRLRIVTGSGYEIVPVVKVNTFHCLGQSLKALEVLGHTFPAEVFVDGLLGMDFLGRFDIDIRTLKGEILIK